MRFKLSMTKWGLFLAAVLIAPVANAKLYKCVNNSGHTSFQEEKCSSKEQTKWEQETRKEARDRKQAEKARHKKAMADDWARIKRFEEETDQEYRNKRAREEMKNKKFISPDDLPFKAKLRIKSHLREGLSNPDSLKDIQWARVLQKGEDIYKVWITYRATNGFGAYIRSGANYTVNSEGEVLSVGD